MMRKPDFEGLESAPRWILIFVGANLFAGALAVYIWNAAGSVFSIQGTPGATSALSVTVLAAVDLWLCLVALRGFPAGAPLRFAWLALALGAGIRVASGVFGVSAGPDTLALLAAGGPLQLALVAAGAFTVLRELRRLGFWRRPRSADWAVCALALLFTLCRIGEVAAARFGGRPVAVDQWISLAGLPVLCVLFLEARLLRQSLACMGNGLIARGWLALVYGILLTGAGELALWVIPHYSPSLPLALFAVLVRLPTAAAFALAPAYQIAAQRRSAKPATPPPDALADAVPALAD